MRLAAPLAPLAAWVLALLMVGRCTAAQPGPKYPAPPPVKATAAILVDAVSGQVLYEKNADLPRPPASTTKIMTALLLLENTRPDDVIVAGPHVADVDGSSLHLVPGEQLTARDLLFALMLRSANDGCVAAAERIAGSESRFAEMMTERARELGATHTVFRNCNGLNDPPNLTTARDLATIARQAIQHPLFNEATRTRYHTVARSIDRRDSVLKNHAFRFLAHFPGADGIKTGYTVPAGHCFVGSATWNGWRLLSIVLHSPDSMGESAALLKYGFSRFEARVAAHRGQMLATVPVRGGDRPAVEATIAGPAQYVLARGREASVTLQARFEPATAPVAAGTRLGTLELVEDGQAIASYPLTAASAVNAAAPAPAVGVGGQGTAWVVFGVLVVGYGTAFAQGARRRGNRVPTGVRGPDRRG